MENPNNKKMTLRVPSPLHAKIKAICKQDRKSFNKRMLALMEREFGEVVIKETVVLER